jgi:NADH:ubiquinone oxidoreductase subunit 6 (subunit J)
MSAAQWLIAVVGVVVSASTFVLMRYPQHRREQYRGRPFSIAASLVTAAIVLAACLVMVWAQSLYEAR